ANRQRIILPSSLSIILVRQPLPALPLLFTTEQATIQSIPLSGPETITLICSPTLIITSNDGGIIQAPNVNLMNREKYGLLLPSALPRKKTEPGFQSCPLTVLTS